MKKIIWILIPLLLVSSIVYSIFLFQHIEETKLNDFETTEEIIYALTDITSIHQAVHFQEATGYHIVSGIDQMNKELLVFVPLIETVSKKDIIVVEKDTILSQEQIESKWAEKCTDCILTGSSPAMINKNPLWELTYKDESNRYVIEYISLKDGSVYEQLRLIRKYN